MDISKLLIQKSKLRFNKSSIVVIFLAPCEVFSFYVHFCPAYIGKICGSILTASMAAVQCRLEMKKIFGRIKLIFGKVFTFLFVFWLHSKCRLFWSINLIIICGHEFIILSSTFTHIWCFKKKSTVHW